MYKIKSFSILLLLLTFLLVACGGNSDNEPTSDPTSVSKESNSEPTATPVSVIIPPESTTTPIPTSTPQPTSTLAPTTTPQPSATPMPVIIPDGYQLLDNQEAGIRLFYPLDWFTSTILDETLGTITIQVASSPKMFESVGLGTDEAYIMVFSESRSCEETTRLFGSSEANALAMLNTLLANPGLLGFGNAEIISPPVVDPGSTDGRDIAIAELRQTYQLGNNIFTYFTILKTYVTDTRFGYFIATGETEYQEQFLSTINTISDSVFLSDPIRETPLVKAGDTIIGEFSEDSLLKDYLYTATAGETLHLTFTPLSENLALSLAIYPAENPCEPIVSEQTFYQEADMINYIFESPGDYIFRVEGKFLEPGSFSLSIDSDEVESVSIGDVLEVELSPDIPYKDYLYTATAGETLTLTSITAQTSDQNLSLTIFSSDDANIPLADNGSGFYPVEELIYTFYDAGEYIIRVTDVDHEGGISYLAIGDEAVPEAVIRSLNAIQLIVGTNEGNTQDVPFGYGLYYYYQAAEGETLTFTLTPGNNEDVKLELLTTDQFFYPIVEANESNSGGAETITYTFTKAAVYIISVSALGEEGPYTLVVSH